MQKAKNSLIIWIGWVLSPLTWWNDPFVNLPISYVVASAITFAYPKSFAAAMIIVYWFTNILGIILMYIGGRNIKQEGTTVKKMANTIIWMALYSLVAYILIKSGWVRPFTGIKL